MCQKHYKITWEQDRIVTDQCDVDGCGKAAHRRGWCNAHYQRALKYGNPTATPQRKSAEERFWTRVDVGGVCWEWTRGHDQHGYGNFYFEGRDVRAHRWAYEFLVGPIPEGRELDHLCRNPPCVNPDHLEPVTRRVNTTRGARPHMHAAKMHCPQGHPYDEVNTYRSPSRPTERICRSCQRIRMRDYYIRRSTERREMQGD